MSIKKKIETIIKELTQKIPRPILLPRGILPNHPRTGSPNAS